jgi:DNA-binding NarL/FixJ family response regulator
MSTKKTILLVEDEPLWITRVEEDLNDHYDLIITTSFSEAQSIILSEIKLDAVIMDIMLPPSNYYPGKKSDTGINLIESLNHHKGSEVPVIVFSFYLQEYRDQMTNFGVYSFLSKSAINPGDLLNLLQKAIIDCESRKKGQPSQYKLNDEQKKELEEGIEKYVDIKTKSIHIPDQGIYELIKPLIGYKNHIENQLSKYLFERNVFVMMKFRDSNKYLGDYIIETLNNKGFQGIRADNPEWQITYNIYNPIAIIYCCKYGIALFDEPEESNNFSPNVAYELGMMHNQHKECLILKQKKLPEMPFDLLKDLYIGYEQDLQVRPIITSWIDQINR